MRYDLVRHKHYFPHSFVEEFENRLYGHWIIGNDYKRKMGYHGEFPPHYLDRVYSLFPNYKHIIHLFSGSVGASMRPGEISFDINASVGCDVAGDAERLSDYFEPKTFDMVIADPPYDVSNAKIYGYRLPRMWKVFQEMRKIVTDDAVVIWLCTRKPMYRKDEWVFKGTIGLDCGTNRVFRGIFIFQPHL